MGVIIIVDNMVKPSASLVIIIILIGLSSNSMTTDGRRNDHSCEVYAYAEVTYRLCLYYVVIINTIFPFRKSIRALRPKVKTLGFSEIITRQ